MLRKHLQRLEQSSEGEDKFESDHGLRTEEEDHEQNEIGMGVFAQIIF